MRTISQTIASRTVSHGTSGKTAPNLQTSVLFAEESALQAFRHSLVATCQTQNALIATFISGLMSQPSLVVRKLFNTSYIIARMSINMIEIFPCSKVNYFKVKKMTGCGNRIPVNYIWHGKNLNGYLDSMDSVIYSTQVPSDCELSQNFPVTLNDQHFEYNREGILRNITSLIPLELKLY